MSMVFKKILVPMDFSETAETALHYARELARQAGGELHLLHVVDDPMLLAAWPMWTGGPAIETGEEGAAIRERLTNLMTPEDRAQLKTEVHVIVGDPTGLAISRYAADGEFELIVMGTHGRGAIAHAVIGSVAEHVVRSAPCPVLTIRHPEHRGAATARLRELARTVVTP
jgi:nucleotide-binding universal stress UspA family protein